MDSTTFSGRSPPPRRPTLDLIRISLPTLFFFAVTGIETARAAVRYVSTSAAGPIHNGNSWATAYTDLQAGLAAAIAGDEIWVAAGVYKATTTTNRTVSFALKNDVAIYGGFAGTETLRAQRNPDSRINGTILSGDIGATGDISDNSWHVVRATDITSASVLDGFTITLGNARGSFPEDRGAGIWLLRSSPMLRNLLVLENTAVVGGGISMDTSRPSIVNAIFHGNVSANSAGAVYCGAMSLPGLTNVVMSGNHSQTDGGALFDATGATPQLVNVTIAGNRGGGIKALGTGPLLKNSIVWNNTGGDGAPLQVDGTLDAASSHNLIDDGTPASNPLFLRDPNPGDGDWQTFVDNDYGDVHLQSDSPAVNVGENAANPELFDLDGNARIVKLAIDLGAFEVPGRIWHVNQDVSGGSGNGTNWANAYTNLQSALGAVSIDDEIWVAAGVYKPTITTDRTASFILRNRVAVYGGFAGTETVRDQRNSNPVSNNTVLSGEIGNTSTNSDNSYHVVTATNVSQATILDGFTITGGRANGAGMFQERGAGIVCNTGGSPALRNLLFTTNSATFGGALYGNQSSPAISQSTFRGNSATDGGAMYLNQGGLLVIDVIMQRNTASNLGGAVRTVGSSASFTNVAFAENSAPTGGALHIGGTGAVQLARSAFTRNSGASGGAIFSASHLNFIVSDTTFAENSSTSVGGAICNSFSSPTLINCGFFGNKSQYGGAIRNDQSGPILINALFVGNAASTWGGAIYNADNAAGETRLINCTFSANHAVTSPNGGAIYSSSATPRLTNCIVWGNTPNAIVGGNIGTNNLIQSVDGATDPRFVRNPQAGDGNWTTPDDNDYGDLRLTANSPALHIGDEAAMPAGVTTDLDGLKRILPPGMDLGAYEAPYILNTVHAVPFGNQTTFADWMPPNLGLTFQFELRSTTGNLAFETPPSVAPDGSLNFVIEPGTTGNAVFHAIASGAAAQSVLYTLTIQVKNEIYPRAAFDYQARQPGAQTAVSGRARVRGYFQPVGQRKGIAIFPGPFTPSLATFTSYNANLEIDTGNGQTPAKGQALSSFPLLAFNRGFDVYTAEWNDARTYVQANAMVIVEMLADLAGSGLRIDPTNNPSLIDRILPGEKLTVIGLSMGGLVSRFALCYLDTQEIPYRCDLFLSVDSPQEGANIPIGLQHLAHYLNDLPDEYKPDDTETLDSVIDAIDQPSPRQMLLLHHSRSGTPTPPYHADERKAFLSLLSTNGNWPTNPNLRMAAIASGRGDGLFEERGGVGAYPTPSKPGGDYRLIDWRTSNEAYNDTTRFTAPLCFDGELTLQINAYLTNTAYAVRPATPSSPSVVFVGRAAAWIRVTGVHIFLFSRTTNFGEGQIDTSGTPTEITTRLRNFIKQSAGMGFSCDILGVDAGIDAAISTFTNKLTELRDMNQTISAYSSQHWDWLPGGYTDKALVASNALAGAGTVTRVSRFQCFVPTVSALAISDFVSPSQQAIPANAADLSPFHEVYHFGAHANTGHVEDFDHWLSQIIAHELRMLCGEFKLAVTPAPLAVGWRGMYELERSDDPGGPWVHLLRAENYVHPLTAPLLGRSFFRLRFSKVHSE